MIKKLITLSVMLFALTLFAQSNTGIKVGQSFPNFELKTVNGKLVTKEMLKGKVVFINLWFTNCPPCIEEMPELNNLRNAYKDKVMFLSITFNKASEVKKFLSKTAFNFKHLVGASDLLNKKLQNNQYPKNIILNRQGRITYINGGMPFRMDDKTGKMVPLPYTFFEKPIESALRN